MTRDIVARALQHAWGKQDTNDRDATFGYLADSVLAGLRGHGYRVLNPAEMAEDCDDPYVCCIHHPPANEDGAW